MTQLPRHPSGTATARRPLAALLLGLAALLAVVPLPGRHAGTPLPLQAERWVEGTAEPSADAEASSLDMRSERQRLEHLVRLGVGRWQSAGYRGRGVKVAVLDS